MADKHTPGRIGRDGSFLWQLDSPSGSGMNLWSGKLSANNGYSEEYALKAAMLFEAAPGLLTIVQKLDAAARQSRNALEFSMLVDAFIEDARAALSKALGKEGEQQS